MSRYVFDYFDGFWFKPDVGPNDAIQGCRVVRIYVLEGDGWPKRRDKYVQLVAESDEALNEQVAIWRRVGCPCTAESMRAAVDAWNDAQSELVPS